jgi:hypothetical protein
VLFLNKNNELVGFFGLRSNKVSSAERTSSWLEFAKKALNTRNLPFTELVRNTLPTLGFAPIMPDSKLTFEMGVFNFWKSATPMLLGSSPLLEIKKQQDENSAPKWFSEGHEAPICFEYVWYDPTHIWVSQIVSNKVNNKHFIDIKLVENLLQK